MSKHHPHDQENRNKGFVYKYYTIKFSLVQSIALNGRLSTQTLQYFFSNAIERKSYNALKTY